MTLKEQADFFTSLADMLRAGFSLKKSLLNVKLLDRKWQIEIDEMILQLNLGATFSQAVEPWISKQSYFQLKMSEQHGNLERAIQELGKFLYSFNEQVQKLRGLLLYPVMLFILLAGLCVSIKVWLLPKLATFSDPVGGAKQVPFFEDPVRVVKGIVFIFLIVILIYFSRVLHWWFNAMYGMHNYL